MKLPAEIQSLPIREVVDDLRQTLLNTSNAVLQAQPGAGKTTGIPLALLAEPWLAGRRLIMLEPRRLAARAAAMRMAELIGEDVGQTVGYRMRLDNRVGPSTRIEVVTEGILTRMLHDDPELKRVDCLIFDEFHERSLNADLGLALSLDTQSVLRPDLRVLVMSATVAAEDVSALLGNAPVIRAGGSMFPVQIRHIDSAVPLRELERAVASQVERMLKREEGSILVFLPGGREIRRVHAFLKACLSDPGIRIVALHGSLPRKMQNEAIRPPPSGQRKVVLSTDIAETSLTIEGIRVVVDSGYRRTPRFDPRTGMTRLETVRISKSSAEQRRGRAGRLSPGICVRLWTNAEHASLADHDSPEMHGADLAPLTLDLADWGVRDPGALKWLDPPPQGAFGQARDLLADLGALDRAGRITAHGREMQRLGTHPRLAHMLLRSKDLGMGKTACEVAALLGERDVLRRQTGAPDPDIALRLEALQKTAEGNRPSIAGMEIERAASRRIRQLARRWCRQLHLDETAVVAPEEAGVVLAHAYPDRIAQIRPGQAGRFLLSNGRGARLPDASPLAAEDYLVVADLDDKGRDARVRLAATVNEADLFEYFQDSIGLRERVEWDAKNRRVIAREEWHLGQLILRQARLKKPAADEVTMAFLQGLRTEGLDCLPWNRDLRQWQARLLFLRRVFGDEWPDVTDEALSHSLETWLAPFVAGMTRLSDLAKVDLEACLNSLLDWEQRQRLDRLAPTHLAVPSGSRIRLDYSAADEPVLSVRLQEMFGAQQTPTVAGGRVPILIELLSPARRPVQMTQDLESFWNETYERVKKDLKGRYPRHYWPDNPWEAEPTRRAKPKGK